MGCDKGFFRTESSFRVLQRKKNSQFFWKSDYNPITLACELVTNGRRH